VIALVVAASRNGCIGRDGDLPWRLPSDLRRFKEITSGGTVVMGRRTWESLPPAFRPLPGRRNVVVTRTPGWSAEGAEVAGSLGEALADGVFVIGGGQIYEQTLPAADRVYATWVDAEVDGDTFFPGLDPAAWKLTSESERHVENGFAFTFRVYDRA
jgi:dihydrofolate reductase